MSFTADEDEAGLEAGGIHWFVVLLKNSLEAQGKFLGLLGSKLLGLRTTLFGTQIRFPSN
jgi:hypothetical protein